MNGGLDSIIFLFLDFFHFSLFYFKFSFYFELRQKKGYDVTSFLSLQPPSCMVVSIREIGNKFYSTSAFHNPASNMTPTSDIDITIDIVDDLFKSGCNNYNEVRGCIMTSNTYSPRTPSIFSSKCDEDYTTRVQYESDNMVEDNLVVMTNSPQLEYATLSSQPL